MSGGTTRSLYGSYASGIRNDPRDGPYESWEGGLSSCGVKEGSQPKIGFGDVVSVVGTDVTTSSGA